MTAAVDAELHASLAAGLAQLSGHLAHEQRRRDMLWQHIHIVPILTAISASGTIDQPDSLGPKEGLWWDLARLSAWGFTAGSVAVYRNSANGEQIAAFPVPGTTTWGKKQMPLGPRDRLIIVATGITGTVQVGGNATEVTAEFWPEYLV